MAHKDETGSEAEVSADEKLETEPAEVGKPSPVEEAPVALEEAAAQEVERLRERLEESEAQAAEYLDGWQRAQAEFSNYKKRQEAERAQMVKLANATLLRKLLPIVDDFERAIATLPASLRQLTWCEGVLLIKHKLDAILESEGVKPVDAEGQIFDPYYHEAVTYEQVSGYEEGQIVGVVQRGYVLDDRVLRPALVRVAKAPEVQPEEDSGATECEAEE